MATTKSSHSWHSSRTMTWKLFDSIFARGLAVIIMTTEPEFFSRIERVMPPWRLGESLISGSPMMSRARSDVSRETVREKSVSTWPSVGANMPTHRPSLNFPNRSGYIFARLGSSTMSVAMTSATVSLLPDCRAASAVISSPSLRRTDSMMRRASGFWYGCRSCPTRRTRNCIVLSTSRVTNSRVSSSTGSSGASSCSSMFSSRVVDMMRPACVGWSQLVRVK